MREEALLDTTWIKDRPEWLQLQNLALATMTGPALRSYPRIRLKMFSRLLTNASHWVQGNNWSFTGTHRQLQGIFPAYVSPSTSFFAEYAVPVLHDSSGYSRRQFGHLCSQRWIHCLGTPLGDPFKTNWREGLSCSPIHFLQYRSWSAREEGLYSGKKVWDVSHSWSHLRREEEIIRILPLRQILKLPLVHKVHRLQHTFLNLMYYQILLVYHQDGLQLHHLLVEEKEREQETNCVSDCVRAPEPQLIPVPMSDGDDDDDQPTKGERQRQRSRSREPVYPHEQVPQEPQTRTYGSSRIWWWDIR